MTEHRPRPDDVNLEGALEDLGSHLRFPPTPDLALTVRTRLESEVRRRPGRTGFVFPRWAIAAVALITLAGGLALFPGARRAIAQWLGLQGIRIHFDRSAPVPPQRSVAPGFGERVSLAEAQARMAFRIMVPTLPSLGQPDEVYVGEPPAGGQVVMVYRTRPGMPSTPDGITVLLGQFHGALEGGYFSKVLSAGTQLESVTVNGGPGYWIEGKLHRFFYKDASGEVREETLRLAGNTLLWEQGGLTLRLESALTKEQALRIAASIR